MDSWKEQVRSKVEKRIDDETIAELANYLEDLFDFNLAQGMPQTEAEQQCLYEMSEMVRVTRQIRKARTSEDAVKERITSFWLPSLASLTTAFVLLALLARLTSTPTIFWHNGAPIVLYVSWLIALPLCGAAGAYLSRRCGGHVLTSLAAGLFPATAMLALFCIVLPVAFVIERMHNPHWTLNISMFVVFVCNWTLIPAIALLIGAAPVCRLRARQKKALL